MLSSNPIPLQLDARLALPGTWELPARQAVSLQPPQPGVLRVASGRIWATGDGPHSGPFNDMGDRVVEAGGQLRLDAGQRLVIEPLNARLPASVSWVPAPPRPGRWPAAWLARLWRLERRAADSGAAA